MANLRRLDRLQTIGELCQEFSVTSRAVRFYEEMGLLQPPRRGTARMFGDRERARLRMILTGKRMRLSIRDIADIIALRDDDDGNLAQRRLALDTCRRRLSVLTRQRDDLDQAMWALLEACGALEAELGPAGAAEDGGHRASPPTRRPPSFLTTQ